SGTITSAKGLGDRGRLHRRTTAVYKPGVKSLKPAGCPRTLCRPTTSQEEVDAADQRGGTPRREDDRGTRSLLDKRPRSKEGACDPEARLGAGRCCDGSKRHARDLAQEPDAFQLARSAQRRHRAGADRARHQAPLFIERKEVPRVAAWAE